jgi:hypothetical protein
LDDRPLLFEHTFEEVRLRGAPAAYNTERGGVWQSQVLVTSGDFKRRAAAHRTWSNFLKQSFLLVVSTIRSDGVR